MLFGHTHKQFLSRIYQEITYPQTKIMRDIRLIFQKRINTKIKEDTSYVNLIYDLNYNAATFDFGYVLLMVDKYSKQNGILFNVIIIKRKRKDIKNWYPISIKKINQRIKDMLIPLAQSYTKCNKIKVYDDISFFKPNIDDCFFPFDLSKNCLYFDYKIFYKYLITPEDYFGIKSDPEILKKIPEEKEFINSKYSKIITLTLRNYSFEKERNTNSDFWLDILSHFKEKYYIVIIPDIENINDKDFYEQFNDYCVLYKYSKNLKMKIALYEFSKLNFFPHTGNSVLSQLNKKSSSITYLKTYNKHNLNEKYFNRIGQNVGETYKFLSNNHKICWNSNKLEIINEANKILTTD